jgi:amino acid permease
LLIHIGFSVLFLHGFAVSTRVLLDGREVIERKAARAAVLMTAAAWLTAITGTWSVYSWYRAKPAHNSFTLAYPQAYLQRYGLSFWHEFGMEWKEHIGWLAPILATTVVVMAVRYRAVLCNDWRVRRFVTAMLSLAFFAALVASALGAAINKVAPNQFLGR